MHCGLVRSIHQTSGQVPSNDNQTAVDVIQCLPGVRSTQVKGHYCKDYQAPEADTAAFQSHLDASQHEF